VLHCSILSHCVYCSFAQSKPSLIPSNCGGEVIWISEAKVAQKTKKLRTQINGEFDDINSSDKINNKISLQSLFLNTIKRQSIYSSIGDSEVVLVFERNNAGVKKL
jgi:hypothetical protein